MATVRSSVQAGEEVHGWRSPGRLVGSQPITVDSSSKEPLRDVMQLLSTTMEKVQTMEEKVQTMDSTLLYMVRERLQNTTAQVLNAAMFGEEAFRPSNCTRFATALATGDSIKDLSNRTGKEEGDIAALLFRRREALADKTINRRAGVHFDSAESLEVEVDSCVEVISKRSELRRTCPSECWVLENFFHFKAAFAPNLG